MPKLNEDLSKHTLFLRDGDYDFLKVRFPRHGAAIIIRKLVSSFVDKLDRPVSRAQVESIISDMELSNVNQADEEVDRPRASTPQPPSTSRGRSRTNRGKAR